MRPDDAVRTHSRGGDAGLRRTTLGQNAPAGPGHTDRLRRLEVHTWTMQGVVPAAGEGTRLRPLTAERPKGLVHVADRPLLTHCFDSLLDVGVDELVVVGYYSTSEASLPRL